MDLEKTVNKLADNEGAIVDTIGEIIAYLEKVDKRFIHLEGHIGQLSKRPAVIVKPNSRFFLVTAVVASGYFGYKMADRRFREKVQEMAKQAKEQVERTAREAREQFESRDADMNPETKPGYIHPQPNDSQI